VQDVGSFHLAIDPGPLIGTEAFAERLAGLLAGLSAIPPAPGFDEVLVPGEPEERAARERAAGIPLPPFIWHGLRAAGERVGVEPPGA
jgi:LDH2 family malate/lactate/ureidoglycolate dehydrogenase